MNQIPALLILVTCVFIFASPASFAQESITAPSPTVSTTTAKSPFSGVRVSVFRPFLAQESRGTERAQSLFEESNQSLGGSIGYSRLPSGLAGYSTNLTWLRYSTDFEGSDYLRWDANIGTSWSQWINVKAGINLSRTLESIPIGSVMPGLGFQASVGVALTKNIGLDLNFVTMKQVSDVYEYSYATSSLSGFETALTGTF